MLAPPLEVGGPLWGKPGSATGNTQDYVVMVRRQLDQAAAPPRKLAKFISHATLNITLSFIILTSHIIIHINVTLLNKKVLLSERKRRTAAEYPVHGMCCPGKGYTYPGPDRGVVPPVQVLAWGVVRVLPPGLVLARGVPLF